jgi:hypothetical protein
MRSGKTRTTSFSLDEATRSNPRRLAARRHGGNVSALISDLAARETKLAAAEAFFERYGVPALSDERASEIEAEWQAEGPSQAAVKPRQKRPAPRRRTVA